MPSLEKRVKEQLEEEILPPCPKCMRLAQQGKIRNETVQPLQSTLVVQCPMDVETKEPICRECNAAWTLMRLSSVPTWEMARVAVANDFQERIRLPGTRLGLAMVGIVEPSKKGDMERHHRWLDHYNWFREEEDNGKEQPSAPNRARRAR